MVGTMLEVELPWILCVHVCNLFALALINMWLAGLIKDSVGGTFPYSLTLETHIQHCILVLVLPVTAGLFLAGICFKEKKLCISVGYLQFLLVCFVFNNGYEFFKACILLAYPGLLQFLAAFFKMRIFIAFEGLCESFDILAEQTVQAVKQMIKVGIQKLTK